MRRVPIRRNNALARMRSTPIISPFFAAAVGGGVLDFLLEWQRHPCLPFFDGLRYQITGRCYGATPEIMIPRRCRSEGTFSWPSWTRVAASRAARRRLARNPARRPGAVWLSRFAAGFLPHRLPEISLALAPLSP